MLPGGYVAGGPFQYRLNAFSPAESAASELDPLLAAEGIAAFTDFRLQSGGEPVPQIAAFQALPSGAFRYGTALIDAMHDPDESCAAGNTAFARAKGAHTRFDGDKGPDYRQNTWFAQGGMAPVGWKLGNNGSVLCAGAAFNVGGIAIDVGNSSAEVDAFVPGGALIGTYRAADGWYVNALAIANRFQTTITTDERGRVGNPGGTGIGVSLQAGHAINVGESENRAFILQPDARLSWQRVWFERFTDVDGVRTSLQGGNSLRGRVGARLKARPRTGGIGTWTPYAGAHVVREFLAGDDINASGVDFPTDPGGTGIRFDAGLRGDVSPGVNVLAEASYENGIGDGTGDTFSATARVVWRF